MSDNRTTIRATEEQKEWINDQDGTHWEVLERLIDAYEEEQRLTENRVRELAREEIRDTVVREAQS